MIGPPRGILRSPSGLSPDTARRPQQRNRCVRLDVALMRKSGCRLTARSGAVTKVSFKLYGRRSASDPKPP